MRAHLLALALVLAADAAVPAPLEFRAEVTFVAPETAAPIGEAAGVVSDALGHVWATDAAAHRLVRWDGDGRWLGESGALGSEANQFRRPTSLARLGSLGVAVLDAENRRVAVFDHLGRRADLAIALDDADLERLTGRVTPIAIAADRGGALYVADSDRDRILAFDFAGHYRRTIGGYGVAPGAFHGLVAFAVAPRGELVTLERAVPAARRGKGARADSAGAGLAARVQWLDPGGTPLVTWTLPEAAGSVTAIAVDDSGRVAVALEGAAGAEVRLHTRAGALLARLRDLRSPRALAFTPDGALLVAEADAGQVRRFRLAPPRGE
jgi:DNA-binding beta-propeller fold protein YncE